MPTAPRKHCPTPGHPAYQGRSCPLCAKDYDARRGNARQRGYDKAWERVRAAYLAAHPVCEMPGCTARAVDVDHKVSVKEAPHRRLDPFNLRGFCKSHHAQRTSRDQIGRDAQGRFAEQKPTAPSPTPEGEGGPKFAAGRGGTVGESCAHSPGKWDFLL